jgi:hypothetical protein
MTFFTHWQPHGCLQIGWFAVGLARYPARMGIRGVVVSDVEVCRARAITLGSRISRQTKSNGCFFNRLTERM